MSCCVTCSEELSGEVASRQSGSSNMKTKTVSRDFEYAAITAHELYSWQLKIAK